MKNRFCTFMDDYQAYHMNPKNKATHYLGIPMIMISLIALLSRITLFSAAGLTFDLALVVLVGVSLFYVTLTLWIGLAMVAVLALMYLAGPHLGTLPAWILFISGWILQFIGHHYEGRKPAFLRNGVHLLVGPIWILNDLLLKLRLPAYTPQKA